MRKSKKNTVLFLVILLAVSLVPQKVEAKHFDFLNDIKFPVDNIKSHFYDDWKEKRGGGSRLHLGLDVRAPKGAKIVAVADGKVNTVAFTESSGYYIAIDHMNGWMSLYVHLNDDIVGNDNAGLGLDVGRAILVGGAPDNPARDIRNYDLSPTGTAITGQTSLEVNGTGAYNNSFFANSVGAFAATGNPAALEVANSNLAQPEQVTSYELGYRGKFSGVIVDASAYYNQYQDFLANETVISPFYGDVGLSQTLPNGTPLAVAAIANGDFQAYQTYTNADEDVNSYGAAIQVSTKVLDGFDLSANYTYAKLDFDTEANPDFRTNFNTPEHKVKVSFGKTELFKNFGFNTSWRWSDNFFWEASFGDGEVPAYSVLDAQINYRIPSLKTTLKVGATNLLQDEYFTAFGTGFIGSMYYASITINNL